MPQAYVGEDLPFLHDVLGVGQESCPRGLASTSVTATSGVVTMAHFTARKNELSTQVRVSTTATAAGATPTLCRIGLFTWDTDAQGVRTGTLVAATANDTTLFAAANTAYTRSWSTPYQMQPGSRYAVGVLVVTGAAAPTLSAQATVSAAEAALAPRLNSSLTGQSDLPATFTNAAITTLANRLYAVVLP